METPIEAALKRTAWLVLLACLAAGGCKNPPAKKVATLSPEKTLMSYDRGESIVSVAAAVASPDRVFVAWSTTEGIYGLFLGPDGLARGKEFRLRSEPARHLDAAVSVCGEKRGDILLLAVPFTSPVEGNKPSYLMVLDPKGRPRSLPLRLSDVGPYSMGGSVTGLCGHAMVAVHLGRIGDFSIEASGLDMAAGHAVWNRTLTKEGLNGFLPRSATNGSHYAVAWFEKKMKISADLEKTQMADLRFAVLDRKGEFVTNPVTVEDTTIAASAPDLVFVGQSLHLAYKDHPTDEYRDGLYLLAAQRDGEVTGNPMRLGRADGPAPPILLSTGKGEMAALVLRGLAGDLLVGINLMDRDGEKLQRELQIYGHSRKLEHVAAASLGSTIVAVYSACQMSHCYLFSSTVERL